MTMINQILKDRVVFVTGSARRVGKAILLAFAEQGANVVIHHSNSDDAAAETAAEAKAMGADTLIVKGNHAHYDEIAANFETITQHFGRLDVLVNSASIFLKGDLLEIPPDEWEQVMAINLSAPFYCTRFAGRIMRDNGIPGSIINIGDNGGLRPWSTRPHHSVSKAGVVMLTQVSARALATYQIRVNCIVPGPILPSADMSEQRWEELKSKLPLKRTGDPGDVARAAVFLSTNEFITGAILRVDGGEFLGAQFDS